MRLFHNNTLFNYSLYLNMASNEIITAGEKRDQLRIAAEKLYDDYLNDPELTAFTILDSEDFVLSINTK
jgi:hypothetical protein